jgi:pantoate--beta-alanine ligase
MQVVSNLPELRQARARLSGPVGLVPTMGYLHVGHLSLVRAARTDCASTVVSIFVNPTQFGPSEDLAAYPRDLSRDLALLDQEGADLVWTPDPDGMYPPGYQTWVSVDHLTARLEGQMRPGHFRGVTTLVTKLFSAVQPDRAYFGQKDAQQALVIRRMVSDLNFPLEVVILPIFREPDGLAMSSRNAYLNPAERQAATVLKRSLDAAQAVFSAGERDAPRLCQVVTEVVRAEPLAALQYVSCADAETLEELQGLVTDRALLSMAAFVGKTRLIDNLILEG